MAVLSWEMLLTRLYSVLLYYHFAFLAVSVAMFGLTIGSLLAYGLKSDSLAEMDEHLASLAALTGFLMAAAMTTQIVLIPPPMVGLVQTAAFWIRIYILSSLPFIPAGIYISLMLTRFENPGKLYAADLVGAGLAAGTLPLILLRCGGPGAVFATAGLALAAACLHTREKQRRPFWIYATFGILFLGFGLLNPWFEESYWRGLLIDATGGIRLLGVIYSSVAFAISHPLIWGVHSVALRHPVVLFGLGVAGGVWGLAYWRTGSLRWTIIGHSCANLLGLSVPVLLNLYVPAGLR